MINQIYYFVKVYSAGKECEIGFLSNDTPVYICTTYLNGRCEFKSFAEAKEAIHSFKFRINNSVVFEIFEQRPPISVCECNKTYSDNKGNISVFNEEHKLK